MPNSSGSQKVRPSARFPHNTIGTRRRRPTGPVFLQCGPSDIQSHLEALYVPLLQAMMGMTFAQATSTFHDLYARAEREAKKEGTINLPVNRGDLLLKKEATRRKTASMLAKRREEGVRDDDIQWWMNRPELERKMVMRVHALSRLALCAKLRERYRLSEEEAARAVKRYVPLFGDPDHPRTSRGDDRPLPWELKNRIDAYVRKRSQEDPANYRKDISESSSFNALIRKEIKTGHL